MPNTWFITELQDYLKRADKVEWDERYITITETTEKGNTLIMVIEKQPEGIRWEQSLIRDGKLYNSGKGSDSATFESLIPIMKARYKELLKASK